MRPERDPGRKPAEVAPGPDGPGLRAGHDQPATVPRVPAPAAAKALGELGPAAAGAIPALEAAARDELAPIREAAKAALEKIR